MTLYKILTNNGQGITRHSFLDLIAFIIALIMALVLHEVAHGLVALWNGDRTAKYNRRLSLNPVKHFDVVGLVLMLLVGFGWAKPVPVNPANFKNRKLGAITVSIAGILTNLIVAFIAAMCYVIFTRIIPSSEGMEYFIYFLRSLSLLLLWLNISFALFNLLPLFPLDGYRLISCFVSENNSFMRFIRRYSLYIMMGIIALDYIPYVSNYSPLNLYIGVFGELIQTGFIKFWRLIF